MDYTRLTTVLDQHSIAYQTDTPIAPYTSFKIGGDARIIIFPTRVPDAILALNAVRDAGLRILVLGNGSNVLVADEGFDGAVLVLSGMNGFSGITSDDADGVVITADAGISLTRLAREAAELSLSGLEFAYGIPGTVGGGVFMNAGAYGGEMAQVVCQSDWLDTLTGETGTYTGAEQQFAYRHSVYSDSTKIILRASYRLSRGDKPAILATMDDYMTRRRDKQPLDYPSAGSVFKRGNGFITAELIQGAGLKGRCVGGAEVSPKHAGFIVNCGRATAADVLELIEIIKQEVFEKYGKTIACEVRVIPYR